MHVPNEHNPVSRTEMKTFKIGAEQPDGVRISIRVCVGARTAWPDNQSPRRKERERKGVGGWDNKVERERLA